MKTLRNYENGFALVSSLVILASLTLVVVTVAYRNTTNELMSANHRDSVEALTIAESGIETGFALVRNNYVKKREFLVDELTPYISSPISAEALSDGNFTVLTPVIDAHYLVMNSVGTTNGAEREIEIVMEIDANATSRYAILTEDDINALEGTPQITGPFANVHSNSDVYAQGNPSISGTVSASGVVNSTGGVDLGAEVSGAAAVDIPYVNPAEYLQYATVIFTHNCFVETPAGEVITHLNSGGTWRGWSCTVNDKWTMSGNIAGDLFEGFYFVKGNVSLTGNPNGLWHVTIVAEGNIEVSGNAVYQPWGAKPGNSTGDHSADEILFLAGNDLKISGTPDQQYNGILAAHMEVQVTGNASVAGSIVAENGRHVMGQEVTSQFSYDIVTANSIEGSMTMDASGTAILGGANPVKVAAWRELVH